MASSNGSSPPDTKDKNKTTVLLEIEDEETRQQRLLSSLERLNASTHSEPSQHEFKFDFGDRTTFPVPPPTGLLSRVQAFLPQLAASNAELERRAAEDPSSVDIECLEDGSERYIEMNLGLGVFEDRSKRTHEEEEDSDTTSGSSTPTSSSESSREDESSLSEGESEGDEDSLEGSSGSQIDTDMILTRPMKPLPKRKIGVYKPSIVVLQDHTPKPK